MSIDKNDIENTLQFSVKPKLNELELSAHSVDSLQTNENQVCDVQLQLEALDKEVELLESEIKQIQDSIDLQTVHLGLIVGTTS